MRTWKTVRSIFWDFFVKKRPCCCANFMSATHSVIAVDSENTDSHTYQVNGFDFHETFKDGESTTVGYVETSVFIITSNMSREVTRKIIGDIEFNVR